ncbi:MAG: D-alanine-D-alanine ligase [Rhodospirillaceae bacterium]|jgi:D-alanine-D-alanine ligase|nr:D-alanine-D-alanine ligase [Rhodospirillaceae bacterium]
MLRIGMTYDLRDDYLAAGYGAEETAEFDSRETIEAIEQALTANGVAPERIGNIRALAARLAAGQRWDFVFNICEGLSGAGREAQVPALLEAYGIPFTFSDTLVMALSLHKGLTKHVLRDKGVPTAPFAVIEAMADLDGFDLPYPVFAKPVAEGTGKGISPASQASGSSALRKVCRSLLTRFRQPVLVETYLPGREFTVGILGSGRGAEAIAVLEVILADGAEAGGYGYVNKEQCESRVVYRLADDSEARAAAEVALAAWRALGCRDAGRVDLRSDAHGQPQFMEVNPLAGLHPTHSDLPILAAQAGLAYERLIGRILRSGLQRVGLARRQVAAAE